METMKKMARPFGALYAMALVIALIGRVGLGIMAAGGTLSFDYISASGVPMLDVICSILTGSAFVAFLFAAGLALSVSTAGCALHGLLFAKGTPGAGKPASAFLWGWATALVAVACLGIVASGILSAVQVGSMSSKLPGTAVLVAGVVAFAAFLGTLLGAASQVVCACIARSRAGRGGLGGNLVAACAVCGVVVMVLTIGTFAALTTTSVEVPVLLAWLAADLAANLIMLFLAAKLLKSANQTPSSAN